jgi:hypothetical protein
MTQKIKRPERIAGYYRYMIDADDEVQTFDSPHYALQPAPQNQIIMRHPPAILETAQGIADGMTDLAC